MNFKNKFLLLVIVSLILISCNTKEEISQREKINFGEEWLFQKGDSIANNWQQVTLPHTTNIEPLVVNNQWQGISWYKKEFVITKKNKNHFIYFESIMQEATVYCNGNLITNHKGGYLPFTADITNFVKDNTSNLILIKVDNTDNATIPPGKAMKVLDFNMYGGIYRNVYLISTNKIHITDAIHANKPNSGGTLIHFDEVSKTSASGILKVHAQNDSKENKTIHAVISFTDKNNKSITFSSDEVEVKSNSSVSINQNITINNPNLWSPETPNLYNVKVQLFSKNKLLDTQTLRTGIRSVEITDKGFFLNGKQRFINGTNRHQEYPYVGYAISDNANYRDAYKIKQAGFDFVRLSHYPHSESFMNACDELGLMTMNCIPGWQYSEKGEFLENSYQDIEDLIRRDRNHPSVIIWENSLNESWMREPYMLKANAILDQELPYKNVYSAGWIDHPSYDLYIPARQHSKAPDYWTKYDKNERKILIAEYGDWEYYAQNAGFNQKAFNGLKEDERTSRQLRSFGEKRLLQQALNYQEAFNSNLKGKHTIGHANWLMFDYNRGYANDLESSGISDVFRIPKFSYYFYQSQKPPYQDEFSKPMVHIASYWQEDSSTKIKVYSNCDEVALYLNDELIERKKAIKNEFSNSLQFPPFAFNIPKFQKGTLKAVAYIENKEISQHLVTTPEKPSKIKLNVDTSNKSITANDIVFVYATITDKKGTTIHNAQNTITFKVNNGDAEIIGENTINAEAGIATIVLKVHSTNEPILLKASSGDLKQSELKIKL